MSKADKRFRAEEIAVFCEQISLILGSDIPLYEGMDALLRDDMTPEEAAAYRGMDEFMKDGGSFAGAVEACGMFPPYMMGMVRVGEESGCLDRVMDGLAAHYACEAQIRSGAIHAVRYPLTLIAVMLLVIAVLVLHVMPVFRGAYMSLSGGVGGASAAMMQAGQTAGYAVFGVMLALLAAGVSLAVLALCGKRPAAQAILLRIRPLKRLSRKMTAQRFASALAMTLGSGFPMEQALELMPAIYRDEASRNLMRDAAQKVIDGQSVYHVIEETGLFDALHLRMIRVGFASGQADTAMEKTAQLLAQEIDDAMARLISMIEPLLVVVLSVMIGAILLAVMMPLAGVLSAML